MDPRYTKADGIRPSQQGTALAKDVWMFGIAVALVLDRKRKAGNRRIGPGKGCLPDAPQARADTTSA